MSEVPEVFAIFEQKLAHVLSFTVVPLKSKDLKNALEEILTYFSSIVERASKAESRIAELEADSVQIQYICEDELPEGISDEVFSAMYPYSKVNFVRMFPFVMVDGDK